MTVPPTFPCACTSFETGKLTRSRNNSSSLALAHWPSARHTDARKHEMASNFTDADWEWPPALRVFCEEPGSIIPGVAEFFNSASALFVIAAGLVPMLTSPFVDELTDLASAACAINGLFSLLVHAFPFRFFGTLDHISILLMNLLYLKTLLITQYPVLLRAPRKCVPPLARGSRHDLCHACPLAHARYCHGVVQAHTHQRGPHSGHAGRLHLEQVQHSKGVGDSGPRPRDRPRCRCYPHGCLGEAHD